MTISYVQLAQSFQSLALPRADAAAATVDLDGWVTVVDALEHAQGRAMTISESSALKAAYQTVRDPHSHRARVDDVWTTLYGSSPELAMRLSTLHASRGGAQ